MTPELPPLLRFGCSPYNVYADDFGGYCDIDSVCDRERILLTRIAELEADAARLDYIERTFSGCTNRERYLEVRMIWGKGCNGRTLREACDKYMRRDAAIDAAREAKP